MDDKRLVRFDWAAKRLLRNKANRQAYDRHIDNIMVQNDVLDTAKMEGWAEGREKGLAERRAEGREEGLAEGREEGREEGRAELIREMLNSAIDKDTIKKITGLSDEALQAL